MGGVHCPFGPEGGKPSALMPGGNSRFKWGLDQVTFQAHSNPFIFMISAAVQILDNKLNSEFALCLHLKGLVPEWIGAQCTTNEMD